MRKRAMKLYTPDNSLLMDIQSISPHPDGLLIEGKIMGAMPMKAVLRPAEMRGLFGLVGWKSIFYALRMLVRRK
jgi:hypothetical protein